MFITNWANGRTCCSASVANTHTIQDLGDCRGKGFEWELNGSEFPVTCVSKGEINENSDQDQSLGLIA